MPQMGESVTEGTVLSWYKQEGEEIAADEPLVEISTDKIDAEVPSPGAGTLVKLHVAEGDTVTVGQVLAEIAPTNGASASHGHGNGNGNGAAAVQEAPETDDAAGETLEIVMPQMGESVTEGTILEWAKSVGDAIAADETIVEISTDKVDAEVPSPGLGHHHRDPRRGGRHRHRRPGPRPHEHCGRGARSVTPTAPGAAACNRSCGHRQRRARAGRRRPSPRSRAAWPPSRASTSRSVAGSGPGGRITKADVLAAKGNGRPPRRRRSRRACAGHRRRGAAHPRRRGDAREVHGREPVDPDRDLVPHADRHGDGRPPQGAQGARASASPSPTSSPTRSPARRPRRCR